MINDAGISNLYHYTYGRTVKSRFFVKRNPALFIELPSPRFISRAPKRKREGGEEQRSRLPRSLWKRGRIVSIYFDIYIMIFYLNAARTRGIKYEEWMAYEEGIYSMET